jgi:hypothetical protein
LGFSARPESASEGVSRQLAVSASAANGSTTALAASSAGATASMVQPSTISASQDLDVEMGEAAGSLVRESELIGQHLVEISSVVRGRDDEIRADATKVASSSSPSTLCQ